MRRRLLLAVLGCALLLPLACGRSGGPTGATDAGSPPRIRPDYADVVFPPNIAPPNFVVEGASRTAVTIAGGAGPPISVRGGHTVTIPPEPWRALLAANRGGEIRFEVSARSEEGTWLRYEPFVSRVAPEEISPYISFRVIDPAFNYWGDVEIHERDLTSYAERPLLRGQRAEHSCVNCHVAHAGTTDLMLFSTRNDTAGSSAILVEDGKPTRLDTKMGYSAFSPDGRTLVYSLNKVRQFFHAARLETRDVIDLDSDLALFDVARRAVTAPRPLAELDRMETYPDWAPDGRSIYFCSAPLPWKPDAPFPPEGWDQVRYELRRVSYDPETGAVGEAETLVSAEEAGGSVLLPRVSPDGRYVLFTVCDYSCFPVFQPSSDLCLLDVRTGEWRRLDELNSRESESWHSWSRDSRWVAFSSKRDDGLLTRTYLSRLGDDGRFSKPFAVPQQDPDLDRSWLKTRSVPELLAEPSPVTAETMETAALAPEKVKVALPDMSMTRKAPPAPPSPIDDRDRE